MIIAEHEVPNDRRTITEHTKRSIPIWSCIFGGTNQKTAMEEKRREDREKATWRRKIGYKSAIKIQKQFKIRIKTKLKFTDPIPAEQSVLKRETNQEIKIFVQYSSPDFLVNVKELLCIFFFPAGLWKKCSRGQEIISASTGRHTKEGEGRVDDKVPKMTDERSFRIFAKYDVCLVHRHSFFEVTAAVSCRSWRAAIVCRALCRFLITQLFLCLICCLLSVLRQEWIARTTKKSLAAKTPVAKQLDSSENIFSSSLATRVAEAVKMINPKKYASKAKEKVARHFKNVFEMRPLTFVSHVPTYTKQKHQTKNPHFQFT